MKIIVWVGGAAALVGTILVTVLATAAVGDAVYMYYSGTVTIDATAKANLAAAILCAYPNADTSKIQRYRFHRTWQREDDPETPEVESNMLVASGTYETTQTDAQYVTDLVAGVAEESYISAAGGNVTYDRKAQAKEMDPSCIAAHDTFVNGLVGRNTDQEIAVECYRLARGQSDIECRDVYVKTASPAQYITDKEAGFATRFLGQVQ